MKETMTLYEFSNIAIEAGFQDLYDINASDIVESGSFADISGDRILEFKVVEMNDDDLEIIIEFDSDLHEDELINPDDYEELLSGKYSDYIYGNYDDVEKIDYGTFLALRRCPEIFLKNNDTFYVKKQISEQRKIWFRDNYELIKCKHHKIIDGDLYILKEKSNCNHL